MVIAASSPHRRDALEVSGEGERESLFFLSSFFFLSVVSLMLTKKKLKLKKQKNKKQKQAVSWAIDELKATVPIWKKEYFVGGGVWKENAEARRLIEGAKRTGGGGGGG